MRQRVAHIVMRLPNFANVRMHWRAKAKIVAEQRETVTWTLLGADWSDLGKPSEESPWQVTLVRLSPQAMDDDGVVSSLKGVRDAFAAFVGVDDKHKHIVRYAYDDERGKKVGVKIYVEYAQARKEAV
jgi:hypothetical protein